MDIGITFDLYPDYLALGLDEVAAAEFDSEDTIEHIEQALRQLGHRTVRIGKASELMQRLLAGERWDLVFNICEGLAGFGRESLVPALLDNHGIPYTFSDPMTLSVALHKGMTKRVLRDCGVPTPDFAILEHADDAGGLTLAYPLFLKPVAEGSSKGIEPASLVRDAPALAARARELLQVFGQPVLVERYLPGREYTVGVLGTGRAARCIGAMEIHLREGAEEGIYSFHNKREFETLVEYRVIDGERLAACGALALQAWRAIGGRDAGRVDLREDGHGTLQVLEVNPLAGLNAVRSDLSILCRLQGIDYGALIGRILDSAIARTPAPRPGPGPG